MTASTMRSATVGALDTQNRFRKCAPCLYEADRGHGDEDRERQHRRHRDVRGRREARRDQRQHVGEEDEQEHRHDVGEVLRALLAGDVLDHLVGEAVDHLGHRLRRARAPAPGRGRRRSSAALTRDDDQRHPERGVGRRCTSAPRCRRRAASTTNWSIGWMLKPLPPRAPPLLPSAPPQSSPGPRGPRSSRPRASARPRPPCPAPRPRCAAWCARRRRSPAGRTAPGTPAGSRTGCPARSRSPAPAACPTTSSITMRQASEPWVNSPRCPGGGSARLAFGGGDPVLEPLQPVGKGVLRHRPGLAPRPDGPLPRV